MSYTAQIFSIGNAIIDFFLNTNWHHVLIGLKIAFGVISALLLAAIVWTVKRHREVLLKAAAEHKAEAAHATAAPDRDEKVFASEEWGRIKKLWASGSSEQQRLSLIEADALLDNTLHDLAVPGETLAERLSNPAAPLMSHVNEVAFAHKFRNELVHEAGATFDAVDAERAYRAYEEVLKELKVI